MNYEFHRAGFALDLVMLSWGIGSLSAKAGLQIRESKTN
jgi:hypothetical protein